MKKKFLFLLVAFTMLLSSTTVLAESIPDQYRSVIEKYISVINGESLPDYPEQFSWMGGTYDWIELDDGGYTLKDINNDGTPELLIGNIPNWSYTGDMVSDIYTLSNGNLKRLAYCWYSDYPIYLTGSVPNHPEFSDCVVKEEDTDRGMIGALRFYKIVNGDLVFSGSFLEEDGKHYISTDINNLRQSETAETRDAFNLDNIGNSVYHFTPFSSYSRQPDTPVNPVPDQPSNPANGTNVYRVYLPTTGEHMFTTDFYEVQVLSGHGWSYEGVAWVAPNSGSPIYRLYSPVTTAHLYTSDPNEISTLQGQGWSVDNGSAPLFYSGGNNCVYRLYSSGLRQHLLTTNADEYNQLGGNGWNQEGIAFYCQ